MVSATSDAGGSISKGFVGIVFVIGSALLHQFPHDFEGKQSVGRLFVVSEPDEPPDCLAESGWEAQGQVHYGGGSLVPEVGLLGHFYGEVVNQNAHSGAAAIA